MEFLTPVCDGDVPWLTYSVSFPGATQATITFVNPTGPDYVLTGQPLSGRVLWPGAEIGQATGEPVDWPGWTQLSDGSWIEGDEWDWVRPSVLVRVEVNPTAEATIGYPPASPLCSANPPKNTTPPPLLPATE